MNATVDLALIPVFVEVVRCQSFSGAARQLGLPRSSVSRQVARLEEQLDTQLLRRTTRRLALTDEGAAYFERAVLALQGLEEARLALAESTQMPRGVLRVSVPFDMAAMLAPIIVELVDRYPELRVEVEPSNRRVDLIAEGYDAALRAGPGLEDSSLVARKILTVPFRVLAASSYVLEHGRPSHPSELVNHRCLLFRPRNGQAIWTLRNDEGEQHRLELTGNLAADDLAFLTALARTGAGVALLPDLTRRDRDGLECLLPGWRGAFESSLYLVYPSARYLPPKLTAFRDFVVAALGRP